MTADALNSLKLGDWVRAIVRISDVSRIYAREGDIGHCVEDGDGTVVVAWQHWPMVDCITQACEIERIAAP